MGVRGAILVAAATAGCILACGTSAGAYNLTADIVFVSPEEGDDALDLTLAYFPGGVRADGSPVWLREFHQRPSGLELAFWDLAGDGDVLVDLAFKGFVDRNRTLAIDARVFNPGDATGLAFASLMGTDTFWPDLWYMFTYAGEYWQAGIDLRPSPRVSLRLPVIAGTLDDSSGAEEFEDDLQWLFVRAEVGPRAMPVEIRSELLLDEFMDLWSVGAWAYPTRQAQVGLNTWWSDADGFEMLGISGAFDLGQGNVGLGVLFDTEDDETVLRLAYQGRF
jgi:hypothetical protein